MSLHRLAIFKHALSHSVQEFLLTLSLFCIIPITATAEEPGDPLKQSTQLALEQALYALPDSQKYAAIPWLLKKSGELEKIWRNEFYRLETLAFIYREAKLNELDPDLVLAVIQVESTFDRKAISWRGARGLMQVMPFWIEELELKEDGDARDLFHAETNIRYGCAILKRYLERSKGDLRKALARYNGSRGQNWYPNKVYLALEKQNP